MVTKIRHGTPSCLNLSNCILLFAAFLSAGTLYCEAPDGRTRLSLSVSEAVKRGLSISEEARIAASQTRESDTGVLIAKSQVRPEVTGQFQYIRTIRTILKNPGNAGLPYGYGQPNNYTTGIGITQPIYRPGALLGIRIAEDYLKTARDQESEARLDLVLRICQAYYDTVLAESLTTISRAQADQLDSQLRDLELRRKVGNVSDLDILRVRVNRENIEPQLVAAANARDNALLGLSQLLNIEKNTDLILTDHLSADGFEPVSDQELGDLVRNALGTRPSIRAAKRMTSIREAQIKQAKAAYLPSVDAIGNLGEQAFPGYLIPSGEDFVDNWSVGFQINIPLYSGGRKKAQIKAAEERANQAWLSLKQAQDTVESQADEAQRQLRRGADLVTTRTRTTTQASRVFQLTELAYKEGAATHLELDDARMNLGQSRAHETQAVHDYYLHYLSLLRVVGVPAESFTSANSLSSHKPGAAMNSSSP